MRKDVAIVVPVYKKLDEYDANERAAFAQIIGAFPSRDIILVCPERLGGEYEGFRKIVLENKFFSYSGYNEMCKAPWFYQIFLSLGYTYMCLVQLDVWVFQDSLDYFLNEFDEKGYDYIGAGWYGVWFAPDGTVGNGGFCIRRLEKFRDICLNYPAGGGNEDVYFLQVHKDKLNVAPTELALEFSWEEKPYFTYKLTKGKLPMGVHAYASSPDRITFWRHFIPGIQEIKCHAGDMDIYDNPNFKITKESEGEAR